MRIFHESDTLLCWSDELYESDELTLTQKSLRTLEMRHLLLIGNLLLIFLCLLL